MSKCSNPTCLLSVFRVGGARTAFRPITRPVSFRDMIFLCTPSCPGPSILSSVLEPTENQPALPLCAGIKSMLYHAWQFLYL